MILIESENIILNLIPLFLSPHAIVVDGTPTGELSKLMAVQVDDETGKNRDLAESMGMKVTFLKDQDKYRYEFIEKKD